jgi:hypothetical protein
VYNQHEIQSRLPVRSRLATTNCVVPWVARGSVDQVQAVHLLSGERGGEVSLPWRSFHKPKSNMTKLICSKTNRRPLLTKGIMKILVLWDVALRRLVNAYRSFRYASYLHLPDYEGSNHFWNVGQLIHIIMLIIQEDNHVHIRSRENLKSHLWVF